MAPHGRDGGKADAAPSGRVHRFAETLGRAFRAREAEAVTQVRAVVTRMVRFRGYAIPSEDHRDLVQEVLLQLWEAVNRPDFDFNRSFEGFAALVAGRRCIDWVRTRKQTTQLSPSMAREGDGPLEHLMEEERVTIVHEVLDQLKESCRKLIRMHVGEKRTYREISGLVGRSEEALRFQMFRCIKEARAILDRIVAAGGAGGRGDS